MKCKKCGIEILGSSDYCNYCEKKARILRIAILSSVVIPFLYLPFAIAGFIFAIALAPFAGVSTIVAIVVSSLLVLPITIPILAWTAYFMKKRKLNFWIVVGCWIICYILFYIYSMYVFPFPFSR